MSEIDYILNLKLAAMFVLGFLFEEAQTTKYRLAVLIVASIMTTYWVVV